MFLIAKDDPITSFSVVPMEDLYRNENFLVGVTDAGGHCEFYYNDKTKYRRFTP